MKPTLTSLQHPLVKHLVKLRKESAYRYAERSLVFTGSKPILEVLPFVKKIIYSESCSTCLPTTAESWRVTEAVMHKISGLVSPEEVIAEVELPRSTPLKNCSKLLVFDGISDPGNMGTLLRTALAFGWQGVFVLPNSCDLFNEKVLRAARGAHFKIPLYQGTVRELQTLIEKEDLLPFVADLQGTAPENVDMRKNIALIMGNEAHGPSQEIKEFCTPITLAMTDQMESLNVAVAGGILLYLLKN